MIVRLNLTTQSPDSEPARPAASRWLERGLLAAGVLALGYFGYIHADTWFYQKYEDWAFERNRAGKTANEQEYLHEVLTPGTGEQGTGERASDETPVDTAKLSNPVISDKSELTPKRQDKALIGRIEIPRVNVSAIVREGADDRTLRRAVGHVPGTGFPGQPGNIGLAGHRDTFFVGLKNIKKTDRIKLRTLDGDYEYEVESIKIVTPKDVEVLAPTTRPVLTLVTCYPFNYVGSAPKRYIVRAKQVSPAPPGDVIEANLDTSDAPTSEKVSSTPARRHKGPARASRTRS